MVTFFKALAFAALAAAAQTGREQANLDDVASKLYTDRFFAGSLADVILENGAADKIIPVSGGEDRAQLRTRLLGWIRANPEAAAKIYEYTQMPESGGGEQIKAVSLKLNPRFVKMVQDLAAAANKSLPPEDLSLAGRKLFEGSGGLDGDFGGGAAIAAAGSFSGNPIVLPNQDWKMNLHNISNEEKATSAFLLNMRQWLDYDKAVTAKTLAKLDLPARALMADDELRQRILARSSGGKTIGDIVDERFAQREALIAGATASQRKFILYTSRFIGRSGAQESEASALESIRKEFRLSLAKVYITGKMDGLERRAPSDKPPAGLPAALAGGFASSGAQLAGDAAALKARYKALDDKLASAPPLESVYSELGALERSEQDWRVVWLLYTKLPSLVPELKDTGYPVALDRLFAKIFERRYPDSPLVAARRALALYERAVMEGLSAISRKDYAAAAELFARISGKNDAKEGVAELERQILGATALLRRSRHCAELAQFPLAEWPFYRVVTPLMRKAESAFGK